MTREDKAKEEMEWRKINENIELEREGVEPLLDSYFVYSTEVREKHYTSLLYFILLVYPPRFSSSLTNRRLSGSSLADRPAKH